MRKQLDPRIPTLINNNVNKNHRSFIVLVGDKGRDQVLFLHIHVQLEMTEKKKPFTDCKFAFPTISSKSVC